MKFSSTYQPATRGMNGRKPKIATVPKDARQRVFGALYHALSLPDKAAADKYLQEQADTLPEFGYLIQVYAKGLMGKNGWEVAEAILDRLFGKPKQTQDVTIGGDRTTFQITVGSPEAAAGLRNALATGAQPASPSEDTDA